MPGGPPAVLCVMEGRSPAPPGFPADEAISPKISCGLHRTNPSRRFRSGSLQDRYLRWRRRAAQIPARTPLSDIQTGTSPVGDVPTVRHPHPPGSLDVLPPVLEPLLTLVVPVA